MTNDPQNNQDQFDVVPLDNRCPMCLEDDIDQLVWINDDQVQCQNCGTIYNPNWNRPATKCSSAVVSTCAD